MTIYYRVVPNNLQKGKYHLRVVRKSKVDLDRLVADIVAESSLSPSDLREAIDALTRRIIDYLQDGSQVELNGLVTFKVSLHESLDIGKRSISQAAQLRVQARSDLICGRR